MCFLRKKIWWWQKFYVNDKFYVSNWNFTAKYVNTSGFPGFLMIFVESFRFFEDLFKIFQTQGFSKFFCLNCQIPGFSRFPGKVAILCIITIIYSFVTML